MNRQDFDVHGPPGTRLAMVVSPWQEDSTELERLLSHRGWKVRYAETWARAKGLLKRRAPVVLVLDCDVRDCDWRDVLTDRPVEAPVVIASSRADDRLWSEVLNLGGYNVLTKPFEASEVEWVLENVAAGVPAAAAAGV